VSSSSEIAVLLQPSPVSDASAFSRMRAFVNNCAGCVPGRSSPPAVRAPRCSNLQCAS
jgi:hypothetical protein